MILATTTSEKSMPSTTAISPTNGGNVNTDETIPRAAIRAATACLLCAAVLALPAPALAANLRASTYGGRTEYQSTRLGNTRQLEAHHIRYVAHRTFPIGTVLLISHGRYTTKAIVADRGPAKWTGKSLDIGHTTARALRFSGVGTVKVRVVGRVTGRKLRSPWWIREATR
jgi:rare lipoprotein A (peptidoglycan hydrolase)